MKWSFIDQRSQHHYVIATDGSAGTFKTQIMEGRLQFLVAIFLRRQARRVCLFARGVLVADRLDHQILAMDRPGYGAKLFGTDYVANLHSPGRRHNLR
jgi:hypothetical protein